MQSSISSSITYDFRKYIWFNKTTEKSTTRYVDSTPTSEVTLVTSTHPTMVPQKSSTSNHPTMVTQKSILWSWMDDWHSFHYMSISCPIPDIRLFQTLTLKLEGQGHGCGQSIRSYGQPSILSTHSLFFSHQSDQQFLRYSYFEIQPWKIQGQGHEWGQRSRSHSRPSIQLMHFLFGFTSIRPTIPEIWPRVFEVEQGKCEGFDS